ncbi:MAG: DUF4091 domain-containing protein [Ruminococcaceae bacterium]|nr:DUF4091 domain-containing protein [Oscillospiraceae bacterium]
MKIKLVSSLENCFLDECIDNKKEYKNASCFKNELFHFAVAFQGEATDEKIYANFSIKSEISQYVKAWRLEYVPVQFAAYPWCDDNYLRKTPGLYPDILQPLESNGRLAVGENLKSLYIEVDTKGEVPSGVYPITLCFTEEKEPNTKHTETFNLEIIDAVLPKQELKFTQWFYTDCLMDYYGTEAFSDEHFEIIENFAKTAVRYGINMLLTPVFTPALDTYIGGERTTTQLVGVEKKNGKYSFDFSLLGRWVDMCNRIGVEYFEIAHFFTQWGAHAAPKIMATVDGEYKKIFGWETDAAGEEYAEFLKAFIPELLQYMKSLDGADKRCWFHISDEPTGEKLEGYMKAKAIVADLLEGYPIIDALSDYEFYSSGAVTRPVPATDHIEPFIENKVPDLWAYYCCVQCKEVSNRFLSMPSYRNRIIGTQLYKYDIDGFLHWGYNYYNNQFSYAKLNPYMSTDGEYFAPSGDTFSVYPGPDKKPWESYRLLVFYDAIQDIRALKLCEELYGKDYVIDLMEKDIEPITFKKYPHSADYLLELREKINMAIKAKI